MKRQFLKWLAGAAATGVLARAPAGEALPVVASFSILADLVRGVGGARVRVTTLVGANADAHEFAPTPAHARALLNARLLVINGLAFEPWAEKLARSANYTGRTLVASQGIAARARDPHAWQDPSNVEIYVQNISQALSQLDPQGASSYQQNSEKYIAELRDLDLWARRQFAALRPPQRRAITSHDALGYLAARYQIKFLAPQGVNPDAQPSAKAVAQLIRQIQREHIKAVFVENLRDAKLLTQIARDTGVRLGPTLYVDALSGANEPAPTYLQMMRHNIAALAAGMALN